MKKFIKKLSGFSHKYFLENDKNNNSLIERATKREKQFFVQHDVPFPKNAMIELTAGCNHACIFCANPRMEIAGKKLELATYRKFIKESKMQGLEEVGFYMRGEPLLDPRLEKFIQIAHDEGLSYIYITTNGALAKIEKIKKLINAGLSSIKFSINSASREKYKEVHGKDDFDKILKNLIDLNHFRRTSKKDLKIICSFVVTKFTQNEIEDYKKLFLPLVDDMKIIGVHGQAGQSLDELELLESTELTAPFPKLGTAKPCGMLWDRIHLTQDGMLSLCCVDYDNNLLYADIKTMSVKEAWNNTIISAMRERHMTQNLKGTLCHNCLYGTSDNYNALTSKENFKNRKQKAIEKSTKSVVNRIVNLSKLH